LAQRSRKRGKRRKGRPAAPSTRSKPVSNETPPSVGGWRVEPQMTRSQRRDAEVRAGLTPIRPGERPGAIVVATAIAALIGVGNIVAWAAGLKVGGKHPAFGGIIFLSVLLVVCAVGMWRLWYPAVLGFMALLAIVTCLFALLLIEASNLLGAVVALAIVAGAGYLFFRMVRVLSRIQMPRYPGR
jgi:hypothetical protein